MKTFIAMTLGVFMLTGCGGDEAQTTTIIDTVDDTITTTKVSLGETLFNDPNLSLTRNQSCATCHNPDHAFIDDRDNGINGAVSAGDDGFSLGDRNAPMVTYALFSPNFSNDGEFIGGQFFDGRASDLVEQAKGPFLNPVEMQMPSESAVVDRLLENDDYVTQMKTLYGETIFDDPSDAYDALADAIGTYEASSEFQTFDSKFDRVKAGQATFTAQEAQGEQLFRDMRCATCHDDRGNNPRFTNFRYENIGIPKNEDVLIANGLGTDHIDHGLLDNPNVTNNREDGKFKVSSLRNIAVTGPYMHNGVFQNLKTVIHFYNTRDNGGINPETGNAWEPSEITANRVGGDRVGNLGLSDAQEDAIVAFLKTLTDDRYEALIP
ncbi:MAG TPA: c-type cytochrome [Helicobacteraceae bacterium]|nr:c-type cytochrome [Helicobacteraceae bacterium]